jgi:hypothetical protein
VTCITAAVAAVVHLTNCEGRGGPDLNSFDSWKFWLSSAAMFAGILVVGLIPGCAKAADAQQHRCQSCAVHAEQSVPRGTPRVSDPAL